MPKWMSDAEAQSRMSDWLADPMEFGQPPSEVEVIWKRVLPWPGKRKKTFLVRWRMPTGEDGIGFVGPLTWSFLEIPAADYDALKRRGRHERIVNLYAGWYHAFMVARGGGPAGPALPDDALAFAGAVAAHRGARLRDLELLEQIGVGEAIYYAFKGELDHDRLGWVPRYFALVRRRRSRAKNLYRQCLVYGGWDADTPIFGRLPLYHAIGTVLGPCAPAFEIPRLGPVFEDY